MLSATQRALFSQHPESGALKPISDRTGQRRTHLQDYFSAKDSTEKDEKRPGRILRYERPDIHGMAKAVLWIAISIILSLLIGNLL